jgi:hypothetical protein
LFTQEMDFAFSLAELKAGKSMEDKMAMIAITINNSNKVNL